MTVKLFRHHPENHRFFGFLVDDFAAGVAVLREVVTAGYRPSVARLYSPEDARQHFAEVHPLDRTSSSRPRRARPPRSQATSARHRGVAAGSTHTSGATRPIRAWFEGLNWGQDKIDAEKQAMLATSHLGYTTEVSSSWSRIAELYESVMRRIRTSYPLADDLTLLGAHSSHSYQTGTNLYFVYDYDIDCEPREEIEQYHKPLNAIIVEEALRVGGSMVHHHGIGKYRTPWTDEEHGTAYPLLAGLKHAFDPRHVMNPGTIFPLESPACGAGRPDAP